MKQHIAAILTLFIGLPLFAQFNETPDYYKCQGRVGGSWQFGRAPYACRASSYGEDNYLSSHFQSLVFDDSQSLSSETQRYMQNLYPTLIAIAKLYFELRNTQVNPTELSYFKQAVLTIAHQESFWSHYRKVDNEYKLMRGDYGHGHGIMQVDDRWHYIATESGTAWDLVSNITYSLDEYYSGWKKAQTVSCVNKSNLLERVQAAYSYYNGGPSKICRFKNTKDTWYKNDKAFLDKWKSRSWERYADESVPPPIPIRCHVLKQPCDPSQPNEPPTSTQWRHKQLYQVAGNKFCLSTQAAGELICQTSIKNIACLKGINKSFHLETQAWEDPLPELSYRPYSPIDYCPQITDRIQKVGQNIILNKNINFRKTPGGSLIKALKKGDVFEVLDFEITNNESYDMYYYLTSEGQEGYVYSGNINSYQDWAIPTQEPLQDHNEKIFEHSKEIIVSEPTRLYKNPDFQSEIQLIQKESLLTIKGFKIIPPENQVFYSVNYKGDLGFIFAGQVHPQLTLNLDFKEPELKEPEFNTLVSHDVTYEWLKSCPSNDCNKTDQYIIGKKFEDLCVQWGCSFKQDLLSVDQVQGDWARVTVKRTLASGWTPIRFIQRGEF